MTLALLINKAKAHKWEGLQNLPGRLISEAVGDLLLITKLPETYLFPPPPLFNDWTWALLSLCIPSFPSELQWHVSASFVFTTVTDVHNLDFSQAALQPSHCALPKTIEPSTGLQVGISSLQGAKWPGLGATSVWALVWPSWKWGASSKVWEGWEPATHSREWCSQELEEKQKRTGFYTLCHPGPWTSPPAQGSWDKWDGMGWVFLYAFY